MIALSKGQIKENIMNSHQKNPVESVCAECGISANVLTCLKKYGMPPKKLCFDVSTSHEGKCDFCGEIKLITQVRDYFYPDFSLLKEYPKLATQREALLAGVGDNIKITGFEDDYLRGVKIGINTEKAKTRSLLLAKKEEK